MFATRKRVKQWIQNTVGTDDDVKLNEVIDRIREMIFQAYARTEVTPTYNICVGLKDYCDTGCQPIKTVKGFTLPWNYETVEAAWVGGRGEPVEVFSDWREFTQSGVRGGSNTIYRQAGYFPTEGELYPCGTCSDIGFISSSSSDHGKKILIEYLNRQLETRKDVINLDSQSRVKTNEPAKKILKIVIQDTMKGLITVTQQSNLKILSEYHPQEEVPNYSRYYVECVNTDCIYIRVTGKNTPLKCDNDLVEVDSMNAAIYYAKAIMGHDTQKPTGSSIQVAEFYQQKAEATMVREKSKSTGKRSKRQITIPTANGRSALNRFRR